MAAPDWRDRLMPYMATVGGIDTVGQTRVDEAHVRDAFGSLWRDDRRPWHLVEPALPEPSLDGFGFPTADRFIGNVETLQGRRQASLRGKGRLAFRSSASAGACSSTAGESAALRTA